MLKGRRMELKPSSRMRCRIVPRSLCIALPLTHMPSSMVAPSCIGGEATEAYHHGSAKLACMADDGWYLKSEPVNALEGHDVAISADDVWSGQR